MTPSDSIHDEHRDAWEMIPWYVNGRLDERQRQRVDAHLRVCSHCREEAAQQRVVRDAMAADGGVEQIPTAGLSRLRLELDRMETQHAVAGPAGRSVRRAAPRRVRQRQSLAASVTLVVVGAALITAARWQATERHGSADYYTVTAAARPSRDAAVRAVFSPSVTLAELQSMLADARLKIVAGPTEAGVYSLAMSGSPSVDWSLQRLRRYPAVRFAEGIAPASEALP